MDPHNKKFGRGGYENIASYWSFYGSRELTGAQDLVSRYKLLPYHEFFCKRPYPMSVLDTHYLCNVVGDTGIRKGEGMQLNQLVQDILSKNTNACIQPFKLDVLREAFQLRETASLYQSLFGNASPRVDGKRYSESKDEHTKHEDGNNESNKEHKKHKHCHKDHSREKEEINKDIKKSKRAKHTKNGKLKVLK